MNTQSEDENASFPQNVYLLARAGFTTSSKLFLARPRDTPKTPTDISPPTPPNHSTELLTDYGVHSRCAGARVATPFGLGKIMAIRNYDGIAAIELQASGLLFYNATEIKNVQVIPALVGERVHTPSGIGCVLKFNAQEELYTLQLESDGNLRASELQLQLTDIRLVVKRKNEFDESELENQRRPRGLSEGSSVDWESRQARARLSTVSTSGVAGLTLLKNIATTSYTFVASRYRHGQPVITKFGAGHILSVDPQRGSAQIQLNWGAIAFIDADMIDFYPKALEGTDVQTKFGSGIVIDLRPADAIYTVRLHDPQPAGKSNVVFVHESDLHRSRKIAVTAANVRDKLKIMAQWRFGERIVVAHQHHAEEPNSAGI